MSIKNVVKSIEEQIEQLHTEMIESNNMLFKSRCRSIKKDLFGLRFAIKFRSEIGFWTVANKIRSDIDLAINAQRRKYDQDPSDANRYGLRTEVKRAQFIRWVNNIIDQAAVRNERIWPL